MSDWQTITDAQKTGESLLLGWWDDDGKWQQTVGCWVRDFEYIGKRPDHTFYYRGAWTDYTVASWGYEEYTELQPTHFAPLLPPPLIGVSNE